MEHRILGLDLLRAAAIGLVLFAHLVPELLKAVGYDGAASWTLVQTGGFLGVEIFFVLSGFLIGTILLRTLRGGVSLNGWLVFMIRRWARTLPLYYVVLAAVAVCLPPAGNLPRHVLHYAFFTQNLTRAMPADNWFGVTWSLAVEEWFYLLFSASLFLLARFVPRRAFGIACAAFLILPLCGRFTVGAAHWDALARKMVLLRLDAIATGVASAYLFDRFRSRLHALRVPAGLAGAGLLAFLLCKAGQLAPMPHISLVLFNAASIGTVLCLPLLAGLKGCGHLWERPVRWLSERSYALYLLHLSVLELALRHVPVDTPRHGALAAAAVVATLFVGTELSYRFLEMPILRRRPQPDRVLLPASALPRLGRTLASWPGRRDARLLAPEAAVSRGLGS